MRVLFYGGVGALGIIAVLVGLSLWWGGAFNEVVVGETEAPEIHAVVIEHQGAYKKGKMKFAQVKKYVNSVGARPGASVGIYFNNPDTTVADDLRSEIGYLIDKKVEVKPPYKYKYFPPREVVSALFEGHPAVGAKRAYQGIVGYAINSTLAVYMPSVEIYTPQGARMLVEYQMPIKRPAAKKRPSKPSTEK